MFFENFEIYGFLGEPNRPKTSSRRTKTNFKDQASASQLNLKSKFSSEPSFIILTNIQLSNLTQTSAAKYWPNFSFKISPEL